MREKREIMPSVLNKKAVDALCAVVGLEPDSVKQMTIKVELPGVVSVNADFYLLPVDEVTTKRKGEQ